MITGVRTWARKWPVWFLALVGFLSFSQTAWPASAKLKAKDVKAAGTSSIDRAGAEKSAAQPPVLRRLPTSLVNANPFSGDINPKKDPVNRLATRMVHVPLGPAENSSVHLNIMGQMFKLSFKLKNKASHDEDAALLRFMRGGDPRAVVPVR